MSRRKQKITDADLEHYAGAILFDGLEPGFVAFGTQANQPIAVYDEGLLMEHLVKMYAGSDEEDPELRAREWIDDTASIYAGQTSPIIVQVWKRLAAEQPGMQTPGTGETGQVVVPAGVDSAEIPPKVPLVPILLEHRLHHLEAATYGDAEDPMQNLSLECLDCSVVLWDWEEPESSEPVDVMGFTYQDVQVWAPHMSREEAEAFLQSIAGALRDRLSEWGSEIIGDLLGNTAPEED
ncbi:hypothetical protein UFOVP613_12 [uncultured Caudovirales phage]|uniref:Uncharacterized protein n=1 Tax=uncultured Caudovirales phage TaxID=2100421 RepID=A0A6J5N9T6_9CAUD|nr:hypothetical protein UFOVP613_12 [uncultured Caudovirales phage]